MADPLLTTLCAICHAQPPKYTCPACHTHTCSLPCSQRHKAWAACTGRRDPTAFLPLHALKTPAGIDHDYNFLSAIERTRERNQRALLDGDADAAGAGGGGGTRNTRRSGLFTEAQLGRDLDSERRWRRQWFGDEVRFVSKDAGGSASARGAANTMMGSDGEEDENEDGDGNDDEKRQRGGGEKMSSLARRVRYRLDAADIEVVRMPVGMARQRDNTTAWNRRAGRINWCVEWIIYDSSANSSSSPDLSDAPPLRIRHKALETRPLYRALGDSLAWYHKGKQRDDQLNNNNADDYSSADDITPITPYARKRRRILIKELKDDTRLHTSFAPPQDPTTTTFAHQTPYPTQNPYTGAWAPADDRAGAVRSWLPDEAIARWRSWRFYLLKAPTPAGKPRELILLDGGGDETLSTALRGRTVVEYPTVYILPPLSPEDTNAEEGDKLPPGFVLGSTERRAPTTKKLKRKADANLGPRNNKNDNKRQRGGGAARGCSRGRGGRSVMARRPRCGDDDDDVEEGEVDSGGEDVAVSRRNGGGGGDHRRRRRRRRGGGGMQEAADTTSSDPDTSSDEDDVEDNRDRNMVEMGRNVAHTAAAATKTNYLPSILTSKAASVSPLTSPQPHGRTAPGLGLVEYGSSSSDDDVADEEGDDDEGEIITNTDLASLKPENPELVTGAIQEIVGLLT